MSAVPQAGGQSSEPERDPKKSADVTLVLTIAATVFSMALAVGLRSFIESAVSSPAKSDVQIPIKRVVWFPAIVGLYGVFVLAFAAWQTEARGAILECESASSFLGRVLFGNVFSLILLFTVMGGALLYVILYQSLETAPSDFDTWFSPLLLAVWSGSLLVYGMLRVKRRTRT